MMKGREGKSPRISVSLGVETFRSVTRAAAASDQSVSSLVAEILEMMSPVLERVAAFKELAARMETESKRGLLQQLQEQQGELERVLGKAIGVMEGMTARPDDERRVPAVVRRRERARRDPRPSNTGVRSVDKSGPAVRKGGVK